MALNSRTEKRIDAQVSEREYDLLLELLLESEDSNVKEALEQALTVVKLIHSEEIDEELKDYKQGLVQDAEEEQERRKKNLTDQHTLPNPNSKAQKKKELAELIEGLRQQKKKERSKSIWESPDYKWYCNDLYGDIYDDSVWNIKTFLDDGSS